VVPKNVKVISSNTDLGQDPELEKLKALEIDFRLAGWSKKLVM